MTLREKARGYRGLARNWREARTHLRRTWWPSASYDFAHGKVVQYAALAREADAQADEIDRAVEEANALAPEGRL